MYLVFVHVLPVIGGYTLLFRSPWTLLWRWWQLQS